MRYPGCVSNESLWIFGYGSLVWRPAFPHLRSRPAAIEGYARRFWQGSTDHRGLPERPGRVVTLLPDAHESLRQGPHAKRTSAPCWGTAYELPIDDPEGVLARLDHRERGGYDRVEVEIWLGEGGAGAPSLAGPIRGLVYIAGPDNANYLGPAPIEAIACQVASARGPSGENPEYVFELARSLRSMGAEDEHVFAVEAAVERALSDGREPGPSLD